MGGFNSKPIPAGTFSSNATGEVVDSYSIRRHPKYADGFLQLPSDLQNAQVLYLRSMEKFRDREYIGSRKVVNGERQSYFTFMKYGEADRFSRSFGSGLRKLGVMNRSMVCVFAENRPEWVLTMGSSYLFGFVMVALYDTFTTEALEFSIKNSQASFILVSRKNLSSLIKVSDETLRQFRVVVSYDDLNMEEDLAAKEKLSELGVQTYDFRTVCEMGNPEEMDFAKIDPEQLLYICYSSGTTGFPKGVMISHRCFITNLLGICNEGSEETFQRHLCYLPLSHVFERMCTSCALYYGGKVGTFSGNVALLTQDLAALRPTVMIVVPRVLQRINEGIQSKLREGGALTRFVFKAAWHGKNFCLKREMGTFVFDAIVFNKIKRMFGGCITQIVNGGAALPADIHELMQVILGTPIRPGYGLSEGGSGNVLNPLKLQHIKYGTSGYPLSNVELRILKVPEFDDPGVGEILMGGSGLCSGYLNDPEATNNLFTDSTHTWIHTGDIGKWDDDNSLVVVDRMRSIFKLNQGEYVAGDLLATYFEAAPLVSNIFVYGDSTRQYLIGIVIPNINSVKRLYNKPNMTNEEFEQYCNSQELEEAIMLQLTNIAKEKKLLGYQKVIAIKCVNDQWTVENGILSPTFKPKRKVLTARYSTLIDELYSKTNKN